MEVIIYLFPSEVIKHNNFKFEGIRSFTNIYYHKDIPSRMHRDVQELTIKITDKMQYID
jgi:hypothetical protein